ncbi:MAG: tRNA preQ1(34) S-adenosylmethionine ribosyltransferase-isomerase QueA [Planctomycetota bacterium]
MRTDLFDYDLPRELVAQHPSSRRDLSRLLVLHRRTGHTEHRVFRDMVEYVRPGDVLVVNNTRVVQARLYGKRSTGGTVEVLLIRPSRERGEPTWECMIRCRGKLRDGEPVRFRADLSATILGRDRNGTPLVELHAEGDLGAILREIGRPPLPPYIKRPKAEDPYAAEDAERYQTVYAEEPGAVAAPTAGLHFTEELLAAIRGKGCTVAAVTLHVGPGTFKPVRSEQVEDHSVDPEYYVVSDEVAAAVNRAERVIAVGTTTTRVLETLARGEGGQTGMSAPPERSRAGEGWTDLFIHPPFEFRAVDALVTNFHLPRSSLLMLVSAFAGREPVLAAYEEAKKRHYRFYSYGDAMLLV